MSSPDRRATEATAHEQLDAAASGRGVISAFQPIVSLPGGEVVGYEALARWPSLDDPQPEAVFTHAAANGGVDHLDQSCIAAALDGALGEHSTAGMLLLINSEPNSPYVGPSHHTALAVARERFEVAFELTERSVLAHPRSLLRKVASIRDDGFAIALDDVGAYTDSLALLDVVQPDIVKLDLSLVQSGPTREQARTLSAVLAHHERTGATILAEGIETDEHLEQALALGATLGQGWRFGRARSIADGSRPVRWTMPNRRTSVPAEPRSPFEVAARTCVPRTVRKTTLLAFSEHIESQAQHSVDPPMVMTALQRVEYFTPGTRTRYHVLAQRCPLVAVFGADLPEDLGGRVRGVPLDGSDPVCREWTVLVLGPHTAAALIARERGTDDAEVDDADRRFDVVMTYDRSVVTRCARSLLDRMR